VQKTRSPQKFGDLIRNGAKTISGNLIIIRNGAKTRSPQNFTWGLNNNKKRYKNNKSPNFV
jgi:hypothetical protein